LDFKGKKSVFQAFLPLVRLYKEPKQKKTIKVSDNMTLQHENKITISGKFAEKPLFLNFLRVL
jgi:hypothetical protein